MKKFFIMALSLCTFISIAETIDFKMMVKTPQIKVEEYKEPASCVFNNKAGELENYVGVFNGYYMFKKDSQYIKEGSGEIPTYYEMDGFKYYKGALKEKDNTSVYYELCKEKI